MKSEVSILNELKNCEYHKVKIEKLLHDYNLCVSENIKIKETNTRLLNSNTSLQSKLDCLTKQNDIFVRASHETKTAQFKDSIFSPSKMGALEDPIKHTLSQLEEICQQMFLLLPNRPTQN